MHYALKNTPVYIIDESKLTKNLEKLKMVSEKSGAKILLAQKGFSAFYFYPLISKYLSGACASSLFEAKLAKTHFTKGEVHTFAASFRKDEIDEIAKLSDHIIFNSFTELKKHSSTAKKHNCQIGLRINPEYSEVRTELYDPCSSVSRLGIKLADFEIEQDISDGIHFHAMCEQGSDVLERILEVVDKKFSHILKGKKWLNMGGGHHITKDNYDIDKLIACVKFFQDKYGLEIYLEPGEAIALDTGVLATSVLDIQPKSGSIQNVIVDTSAACHMPDVLEMPYRPHIIGSFENYESGRHGYRLGGPTCLAGDIIGTYYFDKPLKVDDILYLTDMAHYTMVKNNTFNGINLPSIAVLTKDKKLKIIKQFGYSDFETRLS